MFFIGLATLNTGKLSAIITDIQGLGFQNIFNRSWQQQWGAGLDTQRVLDLETVDSRFPLCHNLCYSGNIALVTYYLGYQIAFKGLNNVPCTIPKETRTSNTNI